MGRVQDAINDHNRIISLAPSRTLIAQAYSDIAAIYNESSRYDQAIAYQTKAIVMCEGGLPFANLKLPYLYRDRSSMWSKMGDITRSQVDSKKATELERRL